MKTIDGEDVTDNLIQSFYHFLNVAHCYSSGSIIDASLSLGMRTINQIAQCIFNYRKVNSLMNGITFKFAQDLVSSIAAVVLYDDYALSSSFWENDAFYGYSVQSWELMNAIQKAVNLLANAQMSKVLKMDIVSLCVLYFQNSITDHIIERNGL